MMNRILLVSLVMLIVSCSPHSEVSFGLSNEVVSNDAQSLSDTEFNNLKARARSRNDLAEHKEVP